MVTAWVNTKRPHKNKGATLGVDTPALLPALGYAVAVGDAFFCLLLLCLFRGRPWCW